MDAWSPFRKNVGCAKNPAPVRSRGRRRTRLAATAGPDAVLTDRDAARAAEAAMQARPGRQVPAWERFSSVPVRPAQRPPDPADGILRLSQAARDGQAAVDGQARTVTHVIRTGPDYGTGPAYEPARMQSPQ